MSQLITKKVWAGRFKEVCVSGVYFIIDSWYSDCWFWSVPIGGDSPVLAEGFILVLKVEVDLLFLFVLHCEEKNVLPHQHVVFTSYFPSDHRVGRTCVFPPPAALNEAEDEEDEDEEHDGADESNQPALGGKTARHFRRHWGRNVSPL